MSDFIDVPLGALPEVLERIADKRIAVEKEVIKYGDAPAGLRDVFELCRGFERAFVNTINYGDAKGPQFKARDEEGKEESPTSINIKEAFSGEDGLTIALKSLPYDEIFDLENVKQVCRQADGYAPHLVSPEKGLRLLASEALDQVQQPVRNCLMTVYNLLVSSAKEAIAAAGNHTEAALLGAMPLNIPDFKTMALPAIVSALDDWRAETEKVLAMIVDQERSYITAGFFRHTMYRRVQRQQQLQAMQQAAQKGTKSGAQPQVAAQPGQPMPQQQQQQQQSGLSARLAQLTGKTGPAPAAPPPRPGVPPGQPPPAAAADDSDSETESDDRAPQKKTNTLTAGNYTISGLDPNDYLAGFFDKYSSNELKGGVPEMWKWQKRFFIFSDSQKTLYYFKGPDDVPKPNGLRGQFGVADCIIEDLDEKGNLRDGPPRAATSVYIRIRPKDPLRTIVKDHKAVYLKAESVQQKIDWLIRMRESVMGRKPEKPVKKEVKKVEEVAQPAVVTNESGSVEEEEIEAPQPQPLPPLEATTSFSLEDTHGFGQGATLFRADSFRDADGKLMPAPRAVLIAPPMTGAEGQPIDWSEAYEASYDRLMGQFGQDLNYYMRMISDTISITVPKAIVHCMVRKAEKNMLERLFAHVHKLTPTELQRLLAEDPEVVALRAGARQALEDLKSAYFEVQGIQEKETVKTGEDRKEKVSVSAKTIALAGVTQLLNQEQWARFSNEFNLEHAPAAVKLSPPGKMPQVAAAAPPQVAAAATAPKAAAPVAAKPSAAPSGVQPTASMARPSAAPGAVPPGPGIRRAPPPPGGAPPGPGIRRAPPPPPPA